MFYLFFYLSNTNHVANGIQTTPRSAQRASLKDRRASGPVIQRFAPPRSLTTVTNYENQKIFSKTKPQYVSLPHVSHYYRCWTIHQNEQTTFNKARIKLEKSNEPDKWKPVLGLTTLTWSLQTTENKTNR